jgi:glutathione S-transferase
MKLYYSKGACSLTIRIVLNELGIATDFIAVDLATKKTEYGDDFLTVNFKGAVPTLVTDDNQVLTENAVILQYLADKNHANTLLPPIPDFQRYRVLEWLNFITTEIHKGFGLLFNAKAPDDVKQQITIPNLIKKFSLLETTLGKNPFLMGDHFTLPDAYLFVMLYWANKKGVDLTSCPELTRFFQDMKQYPSIKQSLLQEEIN